MSEVQTPCWTGRVERPWNHMHREPPTKPHCPVTPIKAPGIWRRLRSLDQSPTDCYWGSPVDTMWSRITIQLSPAPISDPQNPEIKLNCVVFSHWVLERLVTQQQMPRTLTSWWGLNVGDSPHFKFTCGSANLQCDSIWRWGLWEVIRYKITIRIGTLWWDQCPYKKRPRDHSTSPCSLPHLLVPSAMWGHREKATICKSEREPLSGSKSVSTLILDGPASRNVRHKCPV